MRRSLWILLCLIAAPSFAAEPELFDPKAIKLCDGTTVDMSQCMMAEEEKARRLLKAVIKSFEDYIAYVAKQNYTEEQQVKELKAALKSVKKHGVAYAEAMGSLTYRNDYPGSIRQLSTPAMRHKLLVRQAEDLIAICTDRVPTTANFDLNSTSWCMGQESAEK